MYRKRITTVLETNDPKQSSHHPKFKYLVSQKNYSDWNTLHKINCSAGFSIFFKLMFFTQLVLDCNSTVATVADVLPGAIRYVSVLYSS